MLERARSLEAAQRSGLLDAWGAACLAVTERLGVAVLLLSEDQRLLLANAPAEELLKRRAGLVLRGERVTVEGAIGVAFAAAIQKAAGSRRSPPALLCVPRPTVGSALTVAVLPLRASTGQPGRALALAVVNAPELHRTPTPEALVALYKLTPAEARLIAALCHGQTLQGYAEATGTALTTVKSHLQAAFSKTGERRQTDLVRKLKADAALLVGR